MSKVLLITNIPAPYRVDLFYYMQTHQQTHEFFVITRIAMRTTASGRLTSANSCNRRFWNPKSSSARAKGMCTTCIFRST